MASEYVLDTFAILALFRLEPGADRVRDILEQARQMKVNCRMSSISLGEAVYSLERKGGRLLADQFLSIFEQLPVVIEEATRERVLAAAHIKARHPLSYADAFAIALAQEYKASVVTGDPEFQRVTSIVDIDWLPQRP